MSVMNSIQPIYQNVAEIEVYSGAHFFKRSQIFEVKNVVGSEVKSELILQTRFIN